MKYFRNFKKKSLRIFEFIVFSLMFYSCVHPIKITKTKQENSSQQEETENPKSNQNNEAGANSEENKLRNEIAKENCIDFGGTYNFDEFDNERDNNKRLHKLKCAYNSSGINALKTILNPDKQNLLHSAAKKDDLNSVKILVLIVKIDVSLKDNFGETPILIASQNNSLEVVKYLIDHNAEVNVQDNNGETPVLNASKNGHLEVVKYLIDHHAEVNVQDNNGETPVLNASKNGHLEVVKYLIDHHANANLKDQDGNASLFIASLYGYLDIIKYLVGKNANVTMQNNLGQTACDLASGFDVVNIKLALNNCTTNP